MSLEQMKQLKRQWELIHARVKLKHVEERITFWLNQEAFFREQSDYKMIAYCKGKVKAYRSDAEWCRKQIMRAELPIAWG